MTTMTDLMKNDSKDVFIYSEMQFTENNSIAKKSSKKFVVGQIFEGADTKSFTRIIKEKDLKSVQEIYPDVKIVASGNKFKMKYTMPAYKLDV